LNAPVPNVRELAPGETALAFRAMRELRTSLEDEAEFVQRVNELERPEGYRLVAAFDEDPAEAAAVAGFRVGHSLAWGLHVYVDDLSTLPDARRRGHAGRLLDWVIEEARRLGCDQVHLDSAVGPERREAHRLYLNKGFVIAGHHFAREAPRG
jgi:GNAT superfamily N-acetyltransferase